MTIPEKKDNTGSFKNPAIDAVITWVDGSDPAWIRQRDDAIRQYCPGKAGHKSAYTSSSRYRDWDSLHYWFRGMERHCPWIRTIHFVTWGHLPLWLNTEHPKLHIVRHEDFIPKEYLPTFNSNAIDLNLFRIPDLSERFISFNDDMFVISDTKPSDFFQGGLPKDSAILSPYAIHPDGIAANEINNLEIINTYFSPRDIRKHPAKWFSPLYGRKMLRTLLFMQYSYIPGVLEPHTPLSFRKSTFRVLWDLEAERMDDTSRSRFRSKSDVTYWTMRQWQLMTGKFSPRSWNAGKYFLLPSSADSAIHTILHPGKTKMICVNDSENVRDFDELREKLVRAWEIRYPEKSSFEKEENGL